VESAAPHVPRAVCLRCLRPARVCYCAVLPHLPTRTRVVILQHPRERDMPIGTARMASLCLPSAALHVGVRWGEHPALAAALSDPARPPILLYPGPGARDVLREPPPGPVTLVVVDGTWSQARTVVRDNPILQSLPRYAFAAPEPSQYRIRREPRTEYCSTIEALMYVLGALEGDPAPFRALLEPLRAMVDAQLACQADAPRRPVRARLRPRPRRWLVPDALTTRFADLVLVVGEANAWPYGPEKRAARLRPDDERPDGDRLDNDRPRDDRPVRAPREKRDELVHWAALRPATGELFEQIAAPAGPLSPSTAFHIELTEAQLLGGASHAELIAAFARFLRPSDVVGAWGTHGPSLLAAAGGALPASLDLRAVGQRLTHRKLGGIEAYAASLDGPPPSLPIAGRAGRRLAMLARIVAHWRGSSTGAAAY
jgi:DTW domain-containing protein YfiP